MISDTSPLAGSAVVPCGTSLPAVCELPALAISAGLSLVGGAPIQPCADVAKYRADRRPCPSHEANDAEKALFLTLFADVAAETSALESVMNYVQSSVKSGLKVSPTIARALHIFPRFAAKYRWKEKTLRATYDRWANSQDWIDLVNCAKAPASWRERNTGLPEAFIRQCVAVYFGRFKRKDGKLQAVEAIHRWWRTGRDIDGVAQPVPGYEVLADGVRWNQRNPELRPDGWDYSNIMRQVKARAAFTPGDRALLHEGTSAAKEQLPQVIGTRNNLRFLEEVTFDDVRTDILIFDPTIGQECELWLLVARDSATRMVLGFVPHPSRPREDGSASHLGLKEMKQLAGFLLERYPLPPYLCTWRVERGTATLSDGSRMALQDLLPDRIRVTYTSMIGGKSPVGYKEKKKGNSRGKGSHESHNRLFHTQGSFLPGQTGAHYGIRPADLKARGEECVEIWDMRNRLPEHLRGQEQYSLLTLRQACDHLFQFCVQQNFRTAHAIEGFEEVLEWYDPTDGPHGKWKHQSAFVPGALQGKVKTRKRMEMPVERAVKLMAGYQWERVSPDIIIAFYEHLARPVKIQPNGEIEFRIDKQLVVFAPPALDRRAALAGIGYLHPQDPKFLHVTNGKGAMLGTWLRRDRIAAGDQEAIAQAMRYTDAALKAVQTYAEELTATERQQLTDIRAHNAELASAPQMITVTDAPTQISGTKTSAVAAALGSIGKQKKKTATRKQELQEFDGSLDELAEQPSATKETHYDDFSTEGLL